MILVAETFFYEYGKELIKPGDICEIHKENGCNTVRDMKGKIICRLNEVDMKSVFYDKEVSIENCAKLYRIIDTMLYNFHNQWVDEKGDPFEFLDEIIEFMKG